MPRAAPQLFEVAGSLPGGLVTEIPAHALGPSQTPDAYGVDLEYAGELRSGGSLPTGDTRRVTEFSDGANTWQWWIDRMWRWEGNVLRWSAPGYTWTGPRQGTGLMALHPATQIYDMAPVGPGNLAVVTDAGTHIVEPAPGRTHRPQVSQFMREVSADGGGQVAEYNGTVFVSGSGGLYALDREAKAQEVSLPVRTAGLCASSALSVDSTRGRIIGADWAYAVNEQKFFDYRTAGFRYTTRALRNRDDSPFQVGRIAFEIVKDDEAEATITYQYRIENRAWVTAETITIAASAPSRFVVERELEDQSRGRVWQARVTALSATVGITRILVSADGYTFQSEDE